MVWAVNRDLMNVAVWGEDLPSQSNERCINSPLWLKSSLMMPAAVKKIIFLGEITIENNNLQCG